MWVLAMYDKGAEPSVSISRDDKGREPNTV